MAISLGTKTSAKDNIKLSCLIDSKSTLPRLQTTEDAEALRQTFAGMIVKTGGILTTMLLAIGITALATRQIVYTAAPLIIEYVATEAVDSLRPE